MYEKLTKCQNFAWFLTEKKYQNTRIFTIFSRKINKIPEFYTIFAWNVPEFYIIIAREIFFPIFFFGGGGHVPPVPRLLRLWQQPKAAVSVSPINFSYYSCIAYWIAFSDQRYSLFLVLSRPPLPTPPSKDIVQGQHDHQRSRNEVFRASYSR